MNIVTSAHPGKREPYSATNEEQSGEARGHPDALARHDSPGATTENCIGTVGHCGGRHCGQPAHDDLPNVISARINELRNERAEPQQRLRIAHQHKKALQKKSPARLWRLVEFAERTG